MNLVYSTHEHEESGARPAKGFIGVKLDFPGTPDRPEVTLLFHSTAASRESLIHLLDPPTLRALLRHNRELSDLVLAVHHEFNPDDDSYGHDYSLKAILERFPASRFPNVIPLLTPSGRIPVASLASYSFPKDTLLPLDRYTYHHFLSGYSNANLIPQTLLAPEDYPWIRLLDQVLIPSPPDQPSNPSPLA